MNRNIVIVNDFADIDGGAAKIAIETAMALTQQFNVYLFTAVPPVSPLLQQSGVNVICINKPDILHDPNRCRAITKGIWDNSVKVEFTKLLSGLRKEETIVHVHTWTKALSSAVFYVTAKLDFHLVLTLHDFFPFCANGGFFDYQQRRICERRSLSAGCLLTNCDARSYSQKIWRVLRLFVQNKMLWRNKHLTLLYISELCKNVATPYIPKGVKMIYLPDPVELGDNEKADISNNEFYLYLGRLSPEKGADLFCKALTELGLKGLLVGDGYIKSELEQKYPQMEFAGWASGERKQQLIKQAKALVFPSFWGETYGLAVAEARSYGIPCIVPDRCAASEQVEDGKTGYIFKTGDLSSLKEAILKYENTDILQMQNNLIKSFDKESLSMETHIMRLVETYNQILRNE